MHLDRALAIAVKAHTGQTDKVGGAYILHPLRIMLKMSTENERMAAILHDVVEDSPITLEDLKQEGFSAAVLSAKDKSRMARYQKAYHYLTSMAATPPTSTQDEPSGQSR